MSAVAAWVPAGSAFRLGGLVFRGRPNLTPDVLAAWEDRFDDQPSLPVLLDRTDRVLLALVGPDHHGDYWAVRGDRRDPVGISRLAEVAEWLFEQDTLRPFRSTRRLFAWARANWNSLDGYALSHGTALETLGLRQLLNLSYWALTDGADEKERRRLDRRLEMPERASRPTDGRRPPLDAGALQVLQLMNPTG